MLLHHALQCTLSPLCFVPYAKLFVSLHHVMQVHAMIVRQQHHDQLAVLVIAQLAVPLHLLNFLAMLLSHFTRFFSCTLYRCR